MAFGKRVTAAGQQAAAPANVSRTAEAAGPLSRQQQQALIAELSAMARAGAPKAEKYRGTVSGRMVNEHGQNANPVLAEREGVADAGEVRRADYYASSALGNLSAIVGVAGGVAAGLSAQASIGFMFVIWGLTAVATGRMMQGKAFVERIYMGRAARLAGLVVILTGVWFIAQGWSAPAVLGYFIADYEAPVRGIFGKP